MSIVVYSSTGCVRCNIVKKYLSGKGVSFVEHDIKTDEGNEAFKKFYRENRKHIRRDSNGIFFPVIMDGDHIVQDAGASLDWFLTGSKLENMIKPNNLGHGWIGSLDISEGDASCFEPFVTIISLLKQGGLMTEVSTDGKNPGLLETILNQGLADRLIFTIRCESLLKADAEFSKQFSESVRCASNHGGTVETHFRCDISGVGDNGVIAAQDLAQVAKIMAEASESNKLPLVVAKPETGDGVNLFPYRTAARRWQVLTEIEK